MVKNIRLIPDKGNDICLQLYNEQQPYAVEKILSVTKRVYEDLTYVFELDSLEPIDKAYVYINGEGTEAIYSDGKFYFPSDSNRGQIFYGVLGFVQISLRVQREGMAEEWYYSEYASVLVKSTARGKNIDAMLKYIYENQEDILLKNVPTLEAGDDKERVYNDFWAQIVLLEEVVNVYESCYGFFRVNSRYKLKSEEVVERAEKLQYMDAKTLHYMVQHPEHLRQEIKGIKYGKQTFLPDKTLMIRNTVTKNIYENQVVVGFLKKVVLDAGLLARNIKNYLELIDVADYNEDGYIISSYLLYKSAMDTLQNFLKRINDVESKLKVLLVSYKRTLEVDNYDCVKQPEPTAIFMSVPQYNRVYTCIIKWFKKVGYQLENEKIMLNFFNAPSVYESYVLAKLVNHIKGHGFSLIDAKQVEYPRNGNWLFQNKEYNNTFYFANEEQSLVLYYEPIIYTTDMRLINNISLYRNNTTSILRDSDKERKGHYYVPDFVLKSVVNGQERYVICDAKYSKLDNVRNKLMPELAYKYIYSISPFEENAIILGMNIFYGITGEELNPTSFYDCEFGKEVQPFTYMVPFSEEMTLATQEKVILQILQDLLGE